jgi:hypothetical protein
MRSVIVRLLDKRYAILCAGTLAISAPLPRQVIVDASTFEVGARVTIQGCVVAGENAGTYVMTGLKEWPVANSPLGRYGPRPYWVDKGADLLRDHLGKTIQLAGTIVSLRESEVEREPGVLSRGGQAAIELPGRDVMTVPYNAGVGMANWTSRRDMKITLLELEVEELLVVAKGCLPVR